MNSDEAYKNKIGERLTRKLAQAVKDQEVTLEELPQISSYILENIDKTTNSSELFQFLEDISQKWPFFSDVLSGEKAELTEQNTKEKVSEISNLISENKIDDALNVATNANNQQGGQS